LLLHHILEQLPLHKIIYLFLLQYNINFVFEIKTPPKLMLDHKLKPHRS
jgi:hypothetical protein